MKIRYLFITTIVIVLTACAPSSSSDFVIASKVQQENLPILVSTLSTKHNYIIYLPQTNAETHEIWAINPESGNKVLIAESNGLFPKSWSPSGNHWLFVDDYSLYISNADGSVIRRAYQLKDKSYIVPWWLTDEVILFEAYVYDDYGKIWPPPHQYYLNIQTGETGRLDPQREDGAGTYLIQGIIPSNESWIQVNGFTSEVEIVDLKGNHTNILSDYQLLNPYGSFGRMEFIPGTDEVVFLASRKDDSDPNKALSGLWKMSLSDQKPQLIAEDTAETQFYDYYVSPDGKYLAYTYVKGVDQRIAIVGLKNQKIEHEWDFPYKLGMPPFFWSPDSHSIALPYATSDQSATFGIQIMDISSGTTKVLVDENVMITNWHYINPQ